MAKKIKTKKKLKQELKELRLRVLLAEGECIYLKQQIANQVGSVVKFTTALCPLC